MSPSLASPAPATTIAGLKELENEVGNYLDIPRHSLTHISRFVAGSTLSEQPDGPESSFPVAKLETQYSGLAVEGEEIAGFRIAKARL